MEEMKKYSEWMPIFEKLNDVKVMDDDGGRQVARDGKTDTLMDRREAWGYFLQNTIMGITKDVKMSKAIEYEIRGLKCDNPECDFIDMDIPFEEYESYVNKPCPKCGQPLLTEADFASAVLVATMTDNLNKFLPPTKEGAKIGHMFMQMSGNGVTEFTGDKSVEDALNNEIKCIDCANFQNMTAMLLFGMECKVCVDCITEEKCLGKNFEQKE